MISSILKKLRRISIERKIPNISEENAAFLSNFLKIHRPKHILEIGTANGYSALVFQQALESLNPELQIVTIEHDSHAHREAVGNFHDAHAKNIIPIYGDAKHIIPCLQDDYFDFVFIDGMKREYHLYLESISRKLAPHGVIILDDVEKFSHKMQALYSFLEDHTIPYQLEKTDIDDSIMIIQGDDFLLQIQDGQASG